MDFANAPHGLLRLQARIQRVREGLRARLAGPPAWPPASASCPRGSREPLEPLDPLSPPPALVQRLRLHAALEPALFAQRFLEPMQRLAAQVQDLPAPAQEHLAGHCGQGLQDALWLDCLELGFFSFQAADGRIFSGHLPAWQRQALETRWRYLCFAGGLLHPLGPGAAQRLGLILGEQNLAWLRGAPAACCEPQGGAIPTSTSDLAQALAALVGGGPSQAHMAEALIAAVWARLRPRQNGPLAPSCAVQASPPVTAAPAHDDRLPADIRSALGPSRHGRHLADLVQAWHQRPAAPACSPDMVAVAEGAAISLAWVARRMRDPLAWVDALARAGLLHTPPDSPGRRVHRLSLSCLGPAQDCLVLNAWACRRLGLGPSREQAPS